MNDHPEHPDVPQADGAGAGKANELVALRRSVVRAVRQMAPGIHDLRLKFEGTRVDARLKIVPNAKTLIANFHGAYNGGSRKPPLFGGFFREVPDAHQISLADPSILARPGSRIAWYAGHEGFDTQAVLFEVLRGVILARSTPRVVLVGASGGGFAALYFGHCLPRSITVAINPQTDILAYSPRLVEEYRRICWPSLTDNRQLKDVTRTSLADLYREGFSNSVIYVQSMGDRVHSHRHMMPFAGAAAATRAGRNVVLHSDFAGQMGHVFSPDMFIDWVRAAALSPTKDATDLLTTWHQLRDAGGRAAPQEKGKAGERGNPARTRAPDGFAPDDLALAERLRSWRDFTKA